MNGWNSEQYLKFKAERTQPSVDLAARIPISSPKNIIDIGCGPGNSTRVLKNKYPAARVLGVDSSEDMIAKAKKDNPDMDFELINVPDELDKLSGRFDIVFSNAVLQWIPDHNALLPRLWELLNEGGTLAAQIPMNFDEPIHKIVERTAGSEKWRDKIILPRLFHTLTGEEYFDIISRLTDDFYFWHTTYFHRMPNAESIMEWYKGTGLRPYLTALERFGGQEAADFEREIHEQVEREYPPRENGELIFRFPRFFFIANKRRII